MSDEYLRGFHVRGRDLRDEVWHRSPYAKYAEEGWEGSIPEAYDEAEMVGFYREKVPVAAVENDVLVELPNQYVIACKAPWMDTHYTGRLVKQRYEPFQLDTMAECLDGLTKHWPLVGTMLLRFGEIMIVQLEIDRYCVGNYDGEEHYTYLTVASDITQNGLFYLRTNTRVVCRNTHNIAMRSLEKIHIPHTPDAEVILEFLGAVEVATIESQKEHKVQLDRMIETIIDDKELDSLLNKTFGKPRKSTKLQLAELDVASTIETPNSDKFMELVEEDRKIREWQKGRNEELKGAVKAQYSKFNDEFPYAANTLYAFYQALTNVTNHSPLFKGNEQKQEISLLTGQKAKINDKGFAAALAMLAEKSKQV